MSKRVKTLRKLCVKRLRALDPDLSAGDALEACDARALKREYGFRGLSPQKVFSTVKAQLKRVPRNVWIGGAVLGGGYLLFRGGNAVMPYAMSVANAAKFMYGLPAQTRPYADELWTAGVKYGVDPFVLAGIMERESISGMALYPKGPAGTGDWTARPAGWLISKHGKLVDTLPLTDGKPRWLPHPTKPSGPYYIPEDEKGWGRGLMQLDWAIHYNWLRTHDWTDPQVMIDKAAEVLAENVKMMQKGGLKGDLLLHAAVSGYNLTPSVALKDALAGNNPDGHTTGGNYAVDGSGRGLGVLDRANKFRAASGITA